MVESTSFSSVLLVCCTYWLTALPCEKGKPGEQQVCKQNRWTHHCDQAKLTSNKCRPRHDAITQLRAATHTAGPDVNTDLLSACNPTAGQSMVQSGTAAVRWGGPREVDDLVRR